jgi:hypothetical protein
MVDTQTGITSAAPAGWTRSTNKVSLFCTFSFVGMAAFFLMGGLAQATTIYTDTLTITGADSTQLGRLSRDGVPSDWSGTKAFPGAINPALTYHYITRDLDLIALESGFVYGGYIQVDFDSNSVNTFLSAYLDSYNPANLATNYLGDAGFSGNGFLGDPGFFQVFVPAAHHLILVLNETTPNAGLNFPGALQVEAFTDTQFTDLEAVPEPGTWALLLSGTAILLTTRRRWAPRLNLQ